MVYYLAMTAFVGVTRFFIEPFYAQALDAALNLSFMISFLVLFRLRQQATVQVIVQSDGRLMIPSLNGNLAAPDTDQVAIPIDNSIELVI